MGDFVESEPVRKLAERTWQDSLSYGAAIISMEVSKGTAAKAKAAAKKALKDSADVEMGNTPTAEASDINLLKKSVASLSKQMASLATPSGKVRVRLSSDASHTNSVLGKRKATRETSEQWQEDFDHPAGQEVHSPFRSSMLRIDPILQSSVS